VGLYRDEALVLRVHKLGEADRIVTLLTRRSGRLRAVARGVRRTTSKFGARLEPFSHVDAQLHVSTRPGVTLHLVTEAVTLDAFGEHLADNYSRYTAGTAMLEAAERFTAEEAEPALRLYLLLVAGLRSLAGAEHPPGLILDSFLLRALGLSGYALVLGECAGCGAPGPHAQLSVPAGGTVCRGCRPAGTASPAPATLALLAALQSGDWQSAQSGGEGARREASGLVTAFLNWHLERTLRSLPLVERR
jgi:DNA repair protein RecO (recombination protein O)